MVLNKKSKLLLTAVSFSALLNTSVANAGIFNFFKPVVHNPLVEAAELGNEGYVKALIANGYPVNSVDANGNTALLRAAYSGNAKVVNALVKGGANINATDKYGRTALHWAAENNFPDIAKTLMQAGADTTIVDKKGQTAFDVAIAQQNVSVASVIDPNALKAVQTEAAFPAVIAAAAVGGGGGISTTTMIVGGSVAAAGAGVAAVAAGGGGGGGGDSAGSGSTPPSDNGGNNNSGGGSGGNNNGGGSGGGGGSTPSPADFETSEYNYSITIGATTYTQYNLNNIKASSAYFRGYTGSGITVAVIDTGVDANHVDLNNGKTLIGIDLVNNDNNASDDNGHGTHVAGTIAAWKNGVAMHGVAYNAKILPVKVLDSSGGGSESDVAEGIDYVANTGTYDSHDSSVKARVINISLGGDSDMPDVKASIVHALEKNVLVAAASGNLLAGQNIGNAAQPIYPAYYASQTDVNITAAAYNTLQGQGKDYGALLAVVATDSSNNIASFSHQCGDAKEWCLAAPGVLTISSYPGQRIAVSSGTSMATPVVSGAAAVLMEAFPHLNSREVAEILLTTATDLGAAGVDDVYGHGLLNLDRATQPIGSNSIPLGNTVGGASIGFDGSTIAMSSAFGDALDNSGLQLAMLDSYNRAYNINLSTLVTPATSNFDDMLTAFGSSNLANKIQMSDNMSFAYDDTAINQPNTKEEDIQHHSRMAFHMSGENSSMDVNYNIPMDMAFSPSALKNVSGSATQGIDRTSFLAFATEGMSYLSEFKVDDTTSMRTGSFYGDQENGAVFGFVNDITKEFSHANVGVQFGMINEENTFLGSTSGGAFALNKNTPTWFYNLSANVPLAEKYSFYGSYNYGVSFPDANSESLFRDISQIESYSFRLGINKQDSFKDGDKIDFVLSQPLMVSGGSANLDLPLGRDVSGNISRGLYGVNLTPTGRELDLGAFYSFDTAENSTISTGAIYRMEPNHVKDAEADTVVMVKYRVRY